jgi:hypothetical protein
LHCPAAIGLTSVAQPLPGVARACLDALQNLLATPPRPARVPDRVLLEPRVVLRASG